MQMCFTTTLDEMKPNGHLPSTPQIGPRGALVAPRVGHPARPHAGAARAGAERVGVAVAEAGEATASAASCDVARAPGPVVAICRDGQEAAEAVGNDDALSRIAAPLRS